MLPQREHGYCRGLDVMLQSYQTQREFMFSGAKTAIMPPMIKRALRTPAPESDPPRGDALMNDLSRDAPGGRVSEDEHTDYARITAPIWYPTVDVLTPHMRENLTRTIEREIIPRLMLVRRPGAQRYDGQSNDTADIAFSYSDVEAFCDAIIRQPLNAAREYIDSLLAKGMSVENVITTVLSSAARHMGLLWDSDRLTFVDVTVGLSRIQQLLRTYGPGFHAGAVAKGPGHRILLAMVPGDQHTFGLSIVEEFFIRAGWDVENAGSTTKTLLLDRVHADSFDVVGLSASGETSREEIAALIALVRDASMNQQVHVVLGGYAFVSRPELALELGADSGARDAVEALRTFEAETKRMQITF